MSKRILFLFVLILGFSGTATAGSSDFERLKTLVGEWEAESTNGKSKITFQLASNGTAVVETLDAGPESMVTVYHADGDTTLLTHYCSIGNQPRMRAQKSSDNSLTFRFVDAANLKDGAVGHMSNLVIRFQDAGNVIEEWTWKEKGEEKVTKFHLRRVK
jgi:hypothetical protein